MAQTHASGFDRFNEVLRSLDDQLQELRDRFDTRRQKVESEFRKRRDRIEEDVRDSSLFQRADEVRKDLGGRVERGRDQLYGVFGLASRAEVQKLNRKLNSISKKVNELAKE